MLVIAFGFAVLFLLLLFLKKKYGDELSRYSKKDNVLLFLYPLAMQITRLLEKRRRSQFNKEEQRFIRLHPKGNGKEQYRRFVLYRTSITLLIVFIFIVFTTVRLINNSKENIIENGRIKRPQAGTDEVSLQFTADEIKNSITLHLKQRRLRGQELEKYFLMIKEQLFKECLAENMSSDRITSSLHFIDQVADPDIEISWQPEDTELIYVSGTVANDGIQEEGLVTYLNLTLTYYQEEIRIYTFPLRVYPPVIKPNEKIREKLLETYNQVEQDTIYDEYVPLPSEISKKKIAWFEKQDYTFLQILFFGIVAASIVYFAVTNEIKKKERLREKQMMFDYSNIISKFTLFISSGMTIRGAWESIVKDYERKRGKLQHYAYEEMITAIHEVKIGVSESIAYENFGNRCMIIPYIKFASILVQNLKKGTTGILPLLELEKKQAFLDRKEVSKRLSEEAGTKLQIPLMIYLVIVFVIVLVPAFVSL